MLLDYFLDRERWKGRNPGQRLLSSRYTSLISRWEKVPFSSLSDAGLFKSYFLTRVGPRADLTSHELPPIFRTGVLFLSRALRRGIAKGSCPGPGSAGVPPANLSLFSCAAAGGAKGVKRVFGDTPSPA